MKRAFTICIFLVSFGTVALHASGGDLGNGMGTQENPYLIQDLPDFVAFATNNIFWAAGMHTKLMCDIDLEPSLPGRVVFSTAVIARDTDTATGYQGTAFSGTFDGNGHVISKLTILETASVNRSYLGLFGKVSPSGTIKNLKVENVSLTSTYYARCIGGVCGENSGTIKNCRSTGTLTGMFQTGGLCGFNDGGYIIDCHTDVAVHGSAAIGGLCGHNSNVGVITNCSANGFVTGTGGSEAIGGLCGANMQQGHIAGSFSQAAVTAGNNARLIGGLCGNNDFAAIVNCCSIGPVSAGNFASDIGGLCGINYTGSIITSYAAGPLAGGTGSTCLGGLCGRVNGSTIVQCFWDTQASQTTKGIGYDPSPYPADVTGKTTAQMKMQETFADAGWDFVNETENGTSDYWRMCISGLDYPRLNWQAATGDLACPDGVGIEDLASLVTRWLVSDCRVSNNCGGVDLDDSDTVDLQDWCILAAHWLAE